MTETARIVLSAGWGDRLPNVPLRQVPYYEFGYEEEVTGRPMRPVFPVQSGPDGGLAILADVEERPEIRQFLCLRPGGTPYGIEVPLDAPGTTHWQIIRYRPDTAGGLHLLEFLLDADDRRLNRLRHIDAAGTTTWSRQGDLDFHHTDAAHLTGDLADLHHPTPGRLWLAPKATTTGLAAIDPATGQTTATVSLDADFRRLIVSPADEALYARMVVREGRRSIVLGRTDLATGEVTLGEPPNVPLQDLLGADTRRRVYARGPEDIAVLAPDGRLLRRLHPCGVVRTTALYVAFQNAPGQFTVVAAGQSWDLAIEAEDETVALVDVLDGPRFVFHLTGAFHLPGRLVTVDPSGRTSTDDDPDTVAAELNRTESRFDLSMAAITPDGALLIPFSDPTGHHILRLGVDLPT